MIAHGALSCGIMTRCSTILTLLLSDNNISVENEPIFILWTFEPLPHFRLAMAANLRG